MKKSLTVILLAVFTFAGFAQEPVKMEYEKEYLPKLKRQQERLANYEKGIAEEEAKIAELKGQIQTTSNETENTWNEIYALVGTDKAGVDAMRSELASFENQVRSFCALPNEELYKRDAEFDQLLEKVAEYRTNKVSLLSEFHNKLNSIEALLKSTRNSVVVPYVTAYMVEKGDSLWKISGKEDIYDDPFKWTDIYKANKDVIRGWQQKYNAVLKEGQNEEDLIYPGQEFTIPR